MAMGTGREVDAAWRTDQASHALPRSAPSIGIRPLKDLVVSAFPESHPLRTVILAEKDALAPLEFLAKMDVWFVLLNRGA